MKKQLLGLLLMGVLLGLVSVTSNAAGLRDKLKGRVLLQVQSYGEAWYVNPIDRQRIYLRNGDLAYAVMRQLGLGISDLNLAKIQVGLDNRFNLTDSDNDGLDDKLEESLGTDPYNPDSDNDGYSDGTEIKNNYNPLGTNKLVFDNQLIARLKGRIVLQVESLGQAWYINPVDGHRYYLANGEAAYQIMRYLSLGIINRDLSEIPISEQFVDVQPDTPPTVPTNPTGDSQAPNAPTNLLALATTTQITLTWTAATDNVGVVGYYILRAPTANGNYIQIANVNALRYINTGLAASTSYYYLVRAYDAAGNVSVDSNLVQATTPASLNPPISPPTNPPTPPTNPPVITPTTTPVQYVTVNQAYSDKIITASIVAPENTAYTWYKNGSQVDSGVSATTFLAHFDGNLLANSGEAPLAQSNIAYVSSKFGQGIRGKAEYPVTNNLDFNEGTIEFWLTLDQPLNSPVYDVTSGDPYIFKYINPNTGEKMMVNIKTAEGILLFTVHSGAAVDPTWANAVQINTAYNDIPINEPILLSITYSKTDNKSSLYLNGFKIAQNHFNNFNFAAVGSNLVIGNEAAVIDEFRILDKALTAEEIKNNYIRGTAFATNEVYYDGDKNLNDNLQLSINLQGVSYTANAVVKSSKISDISPAGYVLSNRNSINLSFNTASAATCRYGKNADNFSDLPYTASGTGTSHSISAVVNSTVSAYDFYIKCQSGNDGDDYAFYRRLRVLPSINNNWPKIGSITWGNNISASEVSVLAKYDLVSLAKDNIARPSLLRDIKEANPQIILLPYINAPDNNISWGVGSFVHYDLFEKLSDSWRLRNAQGQYMANLYYPTVMNYNLLTSLPWAEALSAHVEDEIISRGDWDGVWYDVADTSFWWLYDYNLNTFTQFPDFDLDGVNENLNNSADLNKAKNIWRDGLAEIMTLTRRAMGNDAIIIGNNSDANAALYNGKMWERFLYYHETTFTDNLSAYLSIDNNNSFVYWNSNTAAPHLNWNLFELDTPSDYQRSRLGLGASLLGGVYYNPASRSSYRQFYWYDEYWVDWDTGQPTADATKGRGYLGQPIGEAYMITDNLWRRDFQHGIVVLNNTTSTATIDLGSKFRYIEGKQDSLANPGGETSSLVLNSRDARILLTTVKNDPLIGPAR